MQARLYYYGDVAKIVWFKHGIKHGKDDVIMSDVGQVSGDSDNAVNDEKLANNISRSRSRVLELALCNPWEWFVTLTLDGRKQQRDDLDGFVKDLGNWVGNFNRKYGCKMKYLLVPELHDDGKSWHMHGLFHDVPASAVVRNEHGYFDIPYYRNRFGYISLSVVKSHERVSHYITKYISKSMSARIGDRAKHLFYSSKGLNSRIIVLETSGLPVLDGAFDGEYTLSKWISDPAELAQILAQFD